MTSDGVAAAAAANDVDDVDVDDELAVIVCCRRRWSVENATDVQRRLVSLRYVTQRNVTQRSTNTAGSIVITMPSPETAQSRS